MKKRLVIIGNGMATGRLLQKLEERAKSQFDITVFGEEPGGSYNRVLLSPLLGGELALEKVITLSSEWYSEHKITLHCDDPVVNIDRETKIVTSAKGVSIPYDALVMATGSNPINIPLPGMDLNGVMNFRTLKDVEQMQCIAAEKKNAVVIGGGFLGLEAAEGLRLLGMNVTLLQRGHHLLDRQLDETAATLLQNTLEARGTRFVLNAETSAIVGNGNVEAVQLANGDSIEADLVVVAIGVSPNKSLAQKSGFICERGIMVDDQMRTLTDKNIYALGECCQFETFIYGLVAPIWQHAEILTSTLLGEHASYREEAVATQLKISGVELFSCGSLKDEEGVESMIYRDVKNNEYRKLWLKDNRLVGAVLYGDVREGQWYFDQLKENNDLSAGRSQLLFGSAFC